MGRRSDAVEPDSAPARVLVTGGAGFIGSHLAEHLLARGIEVQVLDDLSSGSLANIGHLLGDRRFSLVEGSAADPELVGTLVAGVDRIFHLAGVVGVRRIAKGPVHAIEGNLRCTEVILSAAADRRVPVLLTSSSEVYGDGPVPFREADPVRPGSTAGPRGGYACAKAMSEWLAFAYAQERGLPVVVARVFNTVGPRQTGEHGMVLPRFARQALCGDPIQVYGDGRQTRCFAHVVDVARALAELMDSPRARGRVLNVGSGIEVSIAELAAMVQRAAGTGAPIVRVPFDRVFPPGFADLPRRLPCLDRLRDALGWVPDTPLQDIVADVLGALADDRLSLQT